MPRRPPRSPRFASLGNLFREARRASPQRQNNGACASDGAGLPRLSRKLCFGKPDGPAPSAEITERARATARVCHGCRRPRSPRFASLGNLFREARRANPQRQNDGSEREGGCRRSFAWPSPGKLFREARRASPQRQNNGERASDGVGLPWLSRKLRDSFGFRFGARGTRCERSNTSQLSARRRKFRANAGPARGFRTSSQLLRLQVLRVGRAAKLAALKLRVSRAGRALLGLARGAPRSSGKLSELGDKSRRTRGSVPRGSLSALGLARGARAASAQTHRS